MYRKNGRGPNNNNNNNRIRVYFISYLRYDYFIITRTGRARTVVRFCGRPRGRAPSLCAPRIRIAGDNIIVYYRGRELRDHLATTYVKRLFFFPLRPSVRSFVCAFTEGPEASLHRPERPWRVIKKYTYKERGKRRPIIAPRGRVDDILSSRGVYAKTCADIIIIIVCLTCPARRPVRLSHYLLGVDIVVTCTCAH